MAKDATPYIEPALILLLQDHPESVEPVPVDRVYPTQKPPNPIWPFVSIGVPTTVPFGASGLDGSAVTLAIHVYAATQGEGEATVGGKELALLILAGIVGLLGGDEGAEFSLEPAGCPYPATAYALWTGSQVVQDGAEADAFHAFAFFTITVSS